MESTALPNRCRHQRKTISPDSMHINQTTLKLPQSITRFINRRVQRGDVSAVLLYGSYARGTQHEQSDVDLIFIVDEGFNSEYIEYERFVFEVLEQTKSNMFSYWKNNLDKDRHWYLWKDVKVLYDREGEGAETVKHALSLVGNRLPWSQERIVNHRQAMHARIDKIQYLSVEDQATAAVLLVEFVRSLAENWFKIRGRFVPSTKEFLALFEKDCPAFAEMLGDFHLNPTDLDGRFVQVRRMLDIVYSPNCLTDKPDR